LRPWSFGRIVRREPGAAVGAAIVIVAVLVAVLAPYIAPYGVNQKVGPPFEAPSFAHLLGTNDIGQDVFTLMMWGARTSLLVGFAAAFIAVAVGGATGLISGYYGRFLDTVLMRTTDYFLALPVVPLMIVVAAIWGAGTETIILIIGLLSWQSTARVIRSQVLTLRERQYILRARAVGLTNRRIVLRHILPQVVPLMVALTALTIGGAIFAEAALAFLGLADPTVVSWGQMIALAFERGAITSGAWWAIVPPGLAIAVVVLGFSLIGRALEDYFNPRLGTTYVGRKQFRFREIEGPRS
jgi:peptide/nickel transport system permease protein